MTIFNISLGSSICLFLAIFFIKFSYIPSLFRGGGCSRWPIWIIQNSLCSEGGAVPVNLYGIFLVINFYCWPCWITKEKKKRCRKNQIIIRKYYLAVSILCVNSLNYNFSTMKTCVQAWGMWVKICVFFCPILIEFDGRIFSYIFL